MKKDKKEESEETPSEEENEIRGQQIDSEEQDVNAEDIPEKDVEAENKETGNKEAEDTASGINGPKMTDLKDQPVEETSDDVLIFQEPKEEDNEYSVLWGLNYFIHYKLKNMNIIVRYTVEIIAISCILMFLPICMLLLFDNISSIRSFYTGLKNVKKMNEPIRIGRIAMFFVFCYIIDTFCSNIGIILFNFGSMMIYILGLQEIVICWAIVQMFYTHRFYIGESLSLYLIYRLFKNYFDASSSISIFEIFDLPLFVIETFLLWISLYLLFLFITKFFIDVLTYEIKRSTYYNEICALNRKLYVFQKLDTISKNLDQIDYIVENIIPEQDIGIGLKYRDFFGSEDEAEAIANNIFVSMNIKKLNFKNIKVYFPNDYMGVYKYLTSQELISDTQMNIKITKKEFRRLARELYRNRKTMGKTLRDRDSIYADLDIILSSITTFFSVLMLCTMFKIDYNIFVASLGTTAITFSWIFADSIKNIYNCFIFLLVIRPYSINDLVVINSEWLQVKRVDLLISTFETFSNKLVYIPNMKLFNTDNIYNITRSQSLKETITLTVDEKTTYENAIELAKYVDKDLENVQIMYKSCEFSSLIDGKLSYDIEFNKNFQDLKQLRQRNDFIIKLFKKGLRSCGIKHKESFDIFF